MTKRQRTSGGPLTADERLAKVCTQREAIAKLEIKLDAKKTELKELREELEAAVAKLYADIEDRPEGELGFRDEEG